MKVSIPSPPHETNLAPVPELPFSRGYPVHSSRGVRDSSSTAEPRSPHRYGVLELGLVARLRVCVCVCVLVLQPLLFLLLVPAGWAMGVFIL